jgi:hypothetical protein
MPYSNSERQRRYRARHLGAGGRRERLQCLILISTKRNLERLAASLGCSITECVEKLINEKAQSVLEDLDDDARRVFLEQNK